MSVCSLAVSSVLCWTSTLPVPYALFRLLAESVLILDLYEESFVVVVLCVCGVCLFVQNCNQKWYF